MNQTEINAVISLSRQDDWGHLMGYITNAIHELQGSLGLMDPNETIEIARVQGALRALSNILNLEESAHEANASEEQS